MSKLLQFGDVVRVDPIYNPQVGQPDDRRWMVIGFDPGAEYGWTTIFVGGLPIVSHWKSLTGFVEVDDDDI